MTGKSFPSANALLAMHLMTSLNLILVQSVFPWVTSGSPSLPSQQSISTHRTPMDEKDVHQTGWNKNRS